MLFSVALDVIHSYAIVQGHFDKWVVEPAPNSVCEQHAYFDENQYKPVQKEAHNNLICAEPEFQDPQPHPHTALVKFCLAILYPNDP